MTTFGNRYTTDETPNKGGSGVVFICEDPNLSRKVAIKFLGPYTEKKRLYDEISALMAIRSKNVVQIYDIIIEPGNIVGIVQEYLEGLALSDNAAKPSSPHDLIKLIYQIANGVADIHAHGLIHRDIKPNNMRRTPESIVKIFDFDLARKFEKGKTVGFKGTPGFAAPELYNFNASFTSAVDVYALGATVVAIQKQDIPALLALNPPKPEEWKKTGELPKLLAGVPGSLVELIGCALSTNPKVRPRAAEIRDEAAAQLLTGKHRALVASGGNAYYCDSSNPSIRLAFGDLGTLIIAYTGQCFEVREVTGDVYIQNRRAALGEIITGSCLLSFGSPSLNTMQRAFAPLNISHPEVVL